MDPTIGMIAGPREVTYKVFLDILQNTESGITIEELCEIACKENEQIADYLGNKWSIEQIHKLRPIIDMLLNHGNIRRILIRPITLKWNTDDDLTDPTDVNINNSLIQQPQEQKYGRHETTSATSATSESLPKIEPYVKVNAKHKIKCSTCEYFEVPYYMKIHQCPNRIKDVFILTCNPNLHYSVSIIINSVLLAIVNSATV